VFCGALATCVSLLAVAYVAAVGSGSTTPSRDSTRLATQPVVARTARLSRLSDVADDAGDVATVRERRVGDIVLVDVAPDVTSLDDELDRERARSAAAHQRLLVWLVVPDCKPCAAVESALGTRELQRALGRTRLVRLNAADFLAELDRIGVPVDGFPGFALLGADGLVTDYVNGGEWDEDTPENIAPVLKSFAEGTYTRRVTPWRGGPHEDQTPI